MRWGLRDRETERSRDRRSLCVHGFLWGPLEQPCPAPTPTKVLTVQGATSQLSSRVCESELALLPVLADPSLFLFTPDKEEKAPESRGLGTGLGVRDKRLESGLLEQRDPQSTWGHTSVPTSRLSLGKLLSVFEPQFCHF